MRHEVSASTFIRNCLDGAFCLFESMASFLPFVDDMTIIDLGSTDGTLRVLKEISRANPRIKVVESHFSRINATAFADAANEAVSYWKHPHGICWYADEIWHENLLKLMDERLSEGHYELSFWRYQLQMNFQEMLWPPHLIHRVGIKEQFHFVDDGTNTSRTWDAKICSNWDGGWFPKWGAEFENDYTKLPTHEMVLDVGAVGGFLENIIGKRKMHAPFWNEIPNVRGKPAQEWYNAVRSDPVWDETGTPFNIPHIMKWHVSRPSYDLRAALVDALKNDDTERMVGL